MQEPRVQSLGWEDPLKEGVSTHSSYSCLENPMDRGPWQATVHGAAKQLDKTERLQQKYQVVTKVCLCYPPEYVFFFNYIKQCY